MRMHGRLMPACDWRMGLHGVKSIFHRRPGYQCLPPNMGHDNFTTDMFDTIGICAAYGTRVHSVHRGFSRCPVGAVWSLTLRFAAWPGGWRRRRGLPRHSYV